MQFEENTFIYDFTDRKPEPPEADILPANIKKSIDNVIKKEGFCTYNVNNRTISTSGGNYLGILREIDVKGKTKDGDKEINIFVKQIIPDDQMKFMSIPECYYKESYFYNKLMEIYEELQDYAAVPQEERFNSVKGFGESNLEAIILENVSKKGFTTLHRMDVVPLTFAELSVKQLAKFHGLSMVLQKQRPEYFEKKLKVLEAPFHFNDEFDSFVNKMSDLTCKELTYDSKKKADKIREDLMERCKKHWDLSRLGMSGCCLCHGDYRTNNILHREVDGEIKEVIPIDYQLIHYGRPLNDFIYFIFTGTDREFRRKHMENLKDLYYGTLQSFLQFFDMDLNFLYPRKEFERQYKETLEYGLLLSMYALPFIFTLESDVPDLGTTDLKEAEFKLDDRYKERMQGIVDDFIQWGYI